MRSWRIERNAAKPFCRSKRRSSRQGCRNEFLSLSPRRGFRSARPVEGNRLPEFDCGLSVLCGNWQLPRPHRWRSRTEAFRPMSPKGQPGASKSWISSAGSRSSRGARAARRRGFRSTVVRGFPKHGAEKKRKRAAFGLAKRRAPPELHHPHEENIGSNSVRGFRPFLFRCWRSDVLITARSPNEPDRIPMAPTKKAISLGGMVVGGDEGESGFKREKSRVF